VSDDLDIQLTNNGLHHWAPALNELLGLLNGSEEWLEGDYDKPHEQIVRGLERISMLSGRARDGAMCELIAELVSWNVAVRKQGQYWNPLVTSFGDFGRDSDMTSGWVHNKRNCTEVDVYKWLIMRVGELNERYRP